MQEKVIELEGGQGAASIIIQFGEGKVIIKPSARALALDADAMDRLIGALLRARGQMVKREKATLYARVPHSLKSEFLSKAQEEGLTQNAAILEAVGTWIGFRR